MDFDQLAREGKRIQAASLERKAKTVHGASTEHVRAEINEQHYVLRLTIAPGLLEAGHNRLEREVCEAINLARIEVDKRLAKSSLSPSFSPMSRMMFDPDG
jgi:hypothetical protein